MDILIVFNYTYMNIHNIMIYINFNIIQTNFFRDYHINIYFGKNAV